VEVPILGVLVASGVLTRPFVVPIPLFIAAFVASGCSDATPTAPAAVDAAQLEAGSPAYGATVSHSRGAYAVHFTYPVCGEMVDFAGELQWQFHTAAPPGHATTNSMLSSKTWFRNVTGVGALSGDTYRMNGQRFSPYGPGIYGGNGARFTRVATQQFIRQGGGKVFEITATYHMVTNPNGLAVEREEYSATCL
jgi:hypothetical protein